MRRRTLALPFSAVVIASALCTPLLSAEAASRRASMIQIDAPFDGPVESASFDPATGQFILKGYEDFHGGTWEGRAYWEAVLRPTLNGRIEFDDIQTFQPDSVIHGCGVGGFQLEEHGYADRSGITATGVPVHATWRFIEGSATGELSSRLRWGEGTFDYVMEPTFTYHDGQTHGTMRCIPPKPRS